MANVKNFGLIGVADNVQFGKAGPKLKQTTGTFEFRNAADSAAAALTAAGITSASGNVTLTTGNLVLTSDAGVVTLGDAGSISRQATGVFQFGGTGAVMVPNGTAAQRPAAPAAAMFRFNDDTDTMEYYNGTAWTTLATGGTAVTSVSVATANGLAGTSSGGTTPTLTLTTTVTGLLKGNGTAISAVVSGTDLKTVGGNSLLGAGDVGTIGPTYGGTGLSSFASGTVLYASAADTWAAAVPGATSGVQPYDADLTSIAGQTGTGYLIRTAADTWTTRTIAGTAGNIVVTNGDGVASNTDINLATVTQANSGNFVKVTLDTFGRVTGNTAVVTADITALVDGTYVNISGDTMAGNLDFGGTNKVTGLAAPTNASDAANKAYVDATAAGLTWKTAVLNATTANVTLSGEQTIDGVLTATSRILVKNQTAPAENGIYVTAAGAWTRATDADSPAELDGAAVFVQQGSANTDTGWVQTNTIVTVGTTAVTWVQFSGSSTYVAGDGLLLSGNTFSVNMGAGITTLPSDEVGIDVVSNLALQLTSGATNGQLTFVLAGGSGLSQSSSGLTIAAAGVTNAMLANPGITINGDSGTQNSVDLGETFLIAGTSAQGISTAVTANTITITAADATTSSKGVAQFDSANFDVTAGVVSIKAGGVDLTTEVAGTLPVANGGTGATSLTATAVLLGNGTSPIATDALLTFVTATNTLTVGTSTISAVDGGDLTITATATNADINLIPNGTGAVVIGPSGNGQISSDAASSLTITGDTALTLVSTTGDVTIDSADDLLIDLPNTTTAKVTLTTVTPANYASGLADADLVNKYYVDSVAGSAAGDVKAVSATFSLAATGTFNIGAVLPAGATILSVKANVTAADTGTGTLSIGKAGGVSAYMTTGENDTQTVGMYLAETMVTEAGSVQVIGTVAGSPAGAGSVKVVVTYQLAE